LPRDALLEEEKVAWQERQEERREKNRRRGGRRGGRRQDGAGYRRREEIMNKCHVTKTPAESQRHNHREKRFIEEMNE